MPTPKNNDTVALQMDTSAQAGVVKYLSSTPSVQLGGTPTTPVEMKATLQADIDATTAADTAKADYLKKVATKKAARATAHALLVALRKYVLGIYGADANVFTDFGFKLPGAAGPQTVAAKAQQIAQAKATRVARGTKGPKAKAKVKGVVAPAAAAAAAPATQAPPANVTK